MPLSELGAIEIADAGRVHRFERDAAGAWFYHGAHDAAEGAHTHEPDPARAERIARALAALGRARAERDFPLGKDGAAYGVASPELVILVYRPGQSQPLVQYAVGHVAPDTVEPVRDGGGASGGGDDPRVSDRQPAGAGPDDGRGARAVAGDRAAAPMRAAWTALAGLAVLAAAAARASRPTPAGATATPRSRSTASASVTR